MDLIQLLASMKDENGRALVEGFYDDVPPFTPEEKKLVAGNVYAHVWQQAMSGEFARAA